MDGVEAFARPTERRSLYLLAPTLCRGVSGGGTNQANEFSPWRSLVQTPTTDSECLSPFRPPLCRRGGGSADGGLARGYRGEGY